MVADAIGRVDDVCASDLGLTAENLAARVGLSYKGQSYRRDSQQVENEDLVSVWFIAASGDILRVWND